MAAQVHLLKALRPEALSAMEVSSVDGFQGREKEAIIISMVRVEGYLALPQAQEDWGFPCPQPAGIEASPLVRRDRVSSLHPEWR